MILIIVNTCTLVMCLHAYVHCIGVKKSVAFLSLVGNLLDCEEREKCGLGTDEVGSCACVLVQWEVDYPN